MKNSPYLTSISESEEYSDQVPDIREERSKTALGPLESTTRITVKSCKNKRNQRKITSMFGTSQNVIKIENTPLQPEMNVERNNEVSEPKLKRSRNSDYTRVSDMDNDISKK